jgi:hypothetical protein
VFERFDPGSDVGPERFSTTAAPTTVNDHGVLSEILRKKLPLLNTRPENKAQLCFGIRGRKEKTVGDREKSTQTAARTEVRTHVSLPEFHSVAPYQASFSHGPKRSVQLTNGQEETTTPIGKKRISYN